MSPDRETRDVTELLHRWSDGDAGALDELMPLVYHELRRIARGHLRRERADHTLQPTALVNEAYLRLAGTRDVTFRDRVHFFGAAAQAMRRVLVDHARRAKARKRGGDDGPVHVADLDQLAGDAPTDVLRLDQALDALAAEAPVPARVVELRYFGGLSIDEAAGFLRVSPATVKRHWTFARAWLYRELRRSA